MPTPPVPDSDAQSISKIVDSLHERSERSYVEVRAMMASYMGMNEYSLGNFDRKFRRGGAPARYELDEVLSLVRAFVHDLPESKRCRADEAFQLSSFGRIALTDFDQLK